VVHLQESQIHLSPWKLSSTAPERGRWDVTRCDQKTPRTFLESQGHPNPDSKVFWENNICLVCRPIPVCPFQGRLR
jgi:hypothetical protein